MDICNETAKRSFFCECIGVTFLAGDTVSLEFIWPGPAPRGGQFFLIKPRRTGVFLARPISVADWKPRESFASNLNEAGTSARNENVEVSASGILRFIITRRGKGSRELVDLRPGEEAELTGPLGNCWADAKIPADLSKEKIDKPVALVSGGIGIAPLLLFARELGGKPFDFYAGFRTASFGLENIKPRSLVVATEDGSGGLKGRIPDFFTPSGYSAVYACGPEPMLKTLGDTCIAGEVPCFISMERHMACGVGACLGCTVKTTAGNRRCCADGPIFNAQEICFEN